MGHLGVELRKGSEQLVVLTVRDAGQQLLKRVQLLLQRCGCTVVAHYNTMVLGVCVSERGQSTAARRTFACSIGCVLQVLDQEAEHALA